MVGGWGLEEIGSMAPTEKNAAGNVDDTVFGVNVDRQHFLLVDVLFEHLT